MRLARAVATPGPGASWPLLARLAEDRAPEAAGEDVTVVALDGPVALERLPVALRELVPSLAGLDARAASEHLHRLGWECSALIHGAHHAELETVLWRPDLPETHSFPGDLRVPMPMFPVVRAHALRGEVVVHAAAVAGRAGAAIVLGVSGRGKSTLARNAARAGYEALCDDGAVVGAGPLGPEVLALPGSCTVTPDTPRPAEGWRPLVAVCLLEQAAREEVTPVDVRVALQRLCEAALHEVPAAHHLPSPLRRRVFDALRDLTHAVPTFRLAVPDHEVAVGRALASLGLDG